MTKDPASPSTQGEHGNVPPPRALHAEGPRVNFRGAAFASADNGICLSISS